MSENRDADVDERTHEAVVGAPPKQARPTPRPPAAKAAKSGATRSRSDYLIPLWAFGFFLLVGAAYGLLSWSEEAGDIASTTAWTTWKVTAAVSVAVAVASAGIAVATIAAVTRETSSGPSHVTRPERLATSLQPSGAERPVQKRIIFWYFVLALVVLASAAAFLEVRPDTRSWPEGLDAEMRSGSVAVAIGLCGLPWLVLVWLLQRRFAALAEDSEAAGVTELRTLWDLLNNIVLAFAVFVVLALVPTGALRAAYYAGDKDPAADKQGAEFPSSDVLLYGAFFAVLLSAIALPMVAAYRTAARRRVLASGDLSDTADKWSDQKDAVDALEALLHLDVGVLRSPITSLTVFTPLITAALAAYLPDLAAT